MNETVTNRPAVDEVNPTCLPSSDLLPMSSEDDSVDGDSPWMGVRRKKKRRKTSSGNSASDDSTDTVTANPSANTTSANPPNAAPATTPNAAPAATRTRIPPIVISGLANWQQLLKSLSAIEFEAKFLGKLLHLKVKTIDHFRALQRLLRGKGVAFHTFTPPVERDLKVTLRGLPPDTPLDDIKEELESMGITPGQVTPLQRMERGDSPRRLPSNTFLLRVKRVGSWEAIWDVKRLLGVTITVDRFNPPKGLAQCYNCQRFGHASENCNLPPRCVKCAGGHLGRECQEREKLDAPVCCNCGGPHPANWRGCSAHKEAMAALRRRKAAPPPPVTGSRQHRSGPVRAPTNTTPGRTYAAATSGQPPQATSSAPVTDATSGPPKATAPRATPANPAASRMSTPGTTPSVPVVPRVAPPGATPIANPPAPKAGGVNPPIASKPPSHPGRDSMEIGPPTSLPMPRATTSTNSGRYRRRHRQAKSSSSSRHNNLPRHSYADSDYDGAATSQTEDDRVPRKRLTSHQTTRLRNTYTKRTPTSERNTPMDTTPHSGTSPHSETSPHPGPTTHLQPSISPAAVIQWLVSVVPLLLSPGDLSPDQLVAKLVQSLTLLVHNGQAP